MVLHLAGKGKANPKNLKEFIKKKKEEPKKVNLSPIKELNWKNYKIIVKK